jgi:predicted ATPase
MDLDGPILDKVKVTIPPDADSSKYPFSIPLVRDLKEIVFPNQVTFIVGENGTGKSTLLEAIAAKTGFGREGGSRNINFDTADSEHSEGSKVLAACMTLSWRKKPKDGYFFRAESFFNVASHIDNLDKEPGFGRPIKDSYGGKSLHSQSHGESFFSFFKNRLGGGGLYVFDEPEAALSPQRQLALLGIIHDVCKNPDSQFLIATHSPILLAYPGARIYSCDGEKLEEIRYEDTKHYDITKNFLDNPGRYLKRLFGE